MFVLNKVFHSKKFYCCKKILFNKKLNSFKKIKKEFTWNVIIYKTFDMMEQLSKKSKVSCKINLNITYSIIILLLIIYWVIKKIINVNKQVVFSKIIYN